MTVFVERRLLPNNRVRGPQTGVALLQVLLLSIIFSLLSLQFNKTARDQIEIAAQFESRVRAQLEVHSVMNEVVFLLLADSVDSLSEGIDENTDLWRNTERFNFFGEPVVWRDNVTVVLQDLSGLLPLMFPDHFLWRRMLLRHMEFDKVEAYLGLWRDIHDSDSRSWIVGNEEPERLPSGGSYLNGFAQNDKALEWVFFDRPDLLSDLRRFSAVEAPYQTNLLFMPKPMLEALFDPLLADEIFMLREQVTVHRHELMSLLPGDFLGQDITVRSSGLIRVLVTANVDGATWSKEHTVRITAASEPPFRIILKN